MQCSCLMAQQYYSSSLTKLSLMSLLLFPFFNPASFADHTTATSLSLLFFSSPLLLSPLSFSRFCFSLTSSNPSRPTPVASRQARMELRRLKQEARNKHAVTVIWAYWQGTKVFQPLSPSSVSLSQLSCHPCPPCPVPSHSRYDTA